MPRQQTHEIVIDAPIEAVWKAISDGEELTRWFVDEATVTPGVGGTISISWGGEEMSSGTIEAWEPNKKLRKKLAPIDMGAAEVRPGGADDRRVHDRAARRQDGAAAGLLRHSRREGVGRLLQRHQHRLGVVLPHAAPLSRAQPGQAAHDDQDRRQGVRHARGDLAASAGRRRAARHRRLRAGARRFSKRRSPRSATPTSGTRCRAGQFVYTMLSLYGKSAGGGRGDPRAAIMSESPVSRPSQDAEARGSRRTRS